MKAAPTRPYLSVIVPAFQGQHVLPKSLAALRASSVPAEAWELIVVDDASLDDTAVVAAEFADTVVRLPGKPRGPAYARNRGAEVARGEIIVFVDADVCVHADTLARFAKVFATEPDVGAVFGSYDASPPASNFVSQYRNLLHHYHHQINGGEAQTFWAGCGAIRAGVFTAADRYDEWHFSRPQIEDIELGNRIHAEGHRIVLRPEIQCTHLKHWTMRAMLVTDLKDRGLPWARLLVAQGSTVKSTSLNLRTREKICTVLVWTAFLIVAASVLTAQLELALGALAALMPVLALNRRLYAFFEQKRGVLFALRVIPLHVLYYCMNGIAAGTGWFLHELVGGPAPDPTVEAFSEIGFKTWPPVPSKRTTGWW